MFTSVAAQTAGSVVLTGLGDDGWLFVDHAEWNIPRQRFRMQEQDGCVGFRPLGAVCTQSLSGAGMRCRAAGSGAEGLALLLAAADAGAPFDGLLLDWLMPGMNGWEVLEQIHAERRLDHLAVMIFTEQPDDRAYQLASRRPNNDIQRKEDLTPLPYRMRKFLTTYSEAGGMGDWRARQLPRTRDRLGGSILFVDDSPTVCAKYGDLLRNNGYTVLIAQSMAQALEVAQRDKRRFKNKRYVLDRGTGLWPVWRAGRPPPRCLSCF